MNILIIHQHYYPEMAGTARRSKELAENFVSKGHKVYVITSMPRDFRSMPNANFKKYEEINGVEVYRINTFFEVKKNVIIRMISYSAFVFLSLIKVLKLSKNVDLIISMAPLSSGILGSLCKIFSKKYHHFDVPDILPDLGISSGMLKNKLLIKVLFKIEKWVYKNSNSISAITKGQINNINQKGVPSSKLEYIPDWIDDKYFINNLKLHKNKISSIINTDKTIISFVGNIGALQNPQVFLKLASSLQRSGYSNFLFLFIGDGIMLETLKSQAKNLALNNIEFIGRVKRELVPAYMGISDILVANYLPNEYMKICIPGKLFEYAISQKPIIMGAIGEAKDLIEKYELGIGVEPSNHNEFKNAIFKISGNKYLFKPRINDFLNDFLIDNVLKSYDKIIKQIFL
jgi:colanic acid biosynthesis glycosyl transferase WcaI